MLKVTMIGLVVLDRQCTLELWIYLQKINV